MMDDTITEATKSVIFELSLFGSVRVECIDDNPLCVIVDTGYGDLSSMITAIHQDYNIIPQDISHLDNERVSVLYSIDK